MTKLTRRAKQIYSERGLRELLYRSIKQISYQFYERVFGSKTWFQFQAFVNNIRYDTVQNPYEIQYIDPSKVQYRSIRAAQTDCSRWKEIGRIVDGTWDCESKSWEHAIKNEILYQAIEDHFKKEVPWEKTEYVKKSLENLRQDDHKNTWRAVVRSEEDLWERCEQLDALYNGIQKNGYKSKRAIFDSQSNDPMGYYPRTYKYTIDEVMIDLARDGEPLLVDGQHRLFIAKICEIEKIPVLVVARHKNLTTRSDENNTQKS